jgi:hypothetical protein
VKFHQHTCVVLSSGHACVQCPGTAPSGLETGVWVPSTVNIPLASAQTLTESLAPALALLFVNASMLLSTAVCTFACHIIACTVHMQLPTALPNRPRHISIDNIDGINKVCLLLLSQSDCSCLNVPEHAFQGWMGLAETTNQAAVPTV